MNEEKTIIEDNDKTIIEDFIQDSRKESSVLKNFKEYTIDKQIEASGESDIYIIYKDAQAFILKLYRMGMNPKEEILRKTKDISDQHVSYFVRIFETGFDEKHKRWYEIQEYIQNGSLKEYKAPKSDLKRIIKNITEGIKILNDSNILHLDIKPANILIRTYNPLELVLTDFGISSILDAELSKKMTQVKGTPLYWSPESFTGVVGKEADFWSLGVIILELLMGKQPFSGIENKVIMYTLSTKGIEIPENLEDDYKLLLKGLLTREPNKRWGYEQVIKWLNGERNIPVYYLHEEVEKEKEYEKPYKFNGKQYFSLKTLVGSFIENEETWNSGKDHLEEGYIKKWLEQSEDYDRASKLKKLVSENSDQALFNFIYTFNKELPFVVYGKLITLQNIHLYLGKDLRKESNKNESILVENLTSGELFGFYQEYVKLTSKNDNDLFRFLKSISANLKQFNNAKDIYEYLNVLFNPDELLLPNGLEDKFGFIIDNFKILITKDFSNKLLLPSDLNDKYNFIVDNIKVLISKSDFERIKNEYILPDELTSNLENNNDEKTFLMFLGNLIKMQKDNILLSKIKYEILIQTYILPKDVKDGLIANTLSLYFDSIKKLKEWSFLVKKSEFKKLQEEFIIPEDLIKDIKEEDFDVYQHASNKLKELNSILVKKSVLEKIPLYHKTKNFNKLNSSQTYFEGVNDLNKYFDSKKKKQFIFIGSSIILVIISFVFLYIYFSPKTLTGHSAGVNSVSYSPDGKYLASGSGDKTIKIWDINSGTEIKILTDNYYVWSVSYSPDGKYLASRNGDENIKIWDVNSGNEIKTLTGHSAGVYSVSYSPDGKYLASGSGSTTEAAGASDRKYLASDSVDKTIKIWNINSGTEIKTLTGHSRSVSSLCYSPDGKYLASGSVGENIKIWDINSGTEIKTLTGHSSSVTSLCYSPDGKYLASGSYDKTIKIWDVNSGTEIKTLTGHSAGVNSVSYSPDGKYLASASEDKTIKIWDINSGTEIKTLTGHSSSVTSLCYSPDGKYLASGSYDKTIKIWNLRGL